MINALLFIVSLAPILIGIFWVIFEIALCSMNNSLISVIINTYRNFKKNIMNKHTVSKVIAEDGIPVPNRYVYRGVEFVRNDNLRGFWGHYETSWNVGGTRIRTTTRRDLLSAIDRYFESQKK